MEPFLGVLKVLNWGVSANWWRLGCPQHCGSPSWGSLLACFLAGLIFGFVTCALGFCYLFGCLWILPSSACDLIQYPLQGGCSPAFPALAWANPLRTRTPWIWLWTLLDFPCCFCPWTCPSPSGSALCCPVCTCSSAIFFLSGIPRSFQSPLHYLSGDQNQHSRFLRTFAPDLACFRGRWLSKASLESGSVGQSRLGRKGVVPKPDTHHCPAESGLVCFASPGIGCASGLHDLSCFPSGSWAFGGLWNDLPRLPFTDWSQDLFCWGSTPISRMIAAGRNAVGELETTHEMEKRLLYAWSFFVGWVDSSLLCHRVTSQPSSLQQAWLHQPKIWWANLRLSFTLPAGQVLSL